MKEPRYWLAFALLLASTIGLRSLSHGENVPVHRPLAETATQIGRWTGRDIPIEQRIVDFVAVDDYLNRV